MVKSADLGQTNDATVFGRLGGAWLRRILVERKVRPGAVAVAEGAAQTPAEMLLIEDDDVVEELATDGADQAFREGVLTWGSR